ncbi:head GIN domain-containing protein [Chitinophaga solisilvae]|uniref:DUF2807 domain-containing protein n=1 Tax=Chitinophaga solisilvae TaxID=1233460 RepID=A0A3S1DT07_9BACT|nr:head GIN domain-containing protein [Chitinophaga solisilvae]NSL91115.1 DUF2807 domain-containing protein [Chitinophaga solisilvae]
MNKIVKYVLTALPVAMVAGLLMSFVWAGDFERVKGNGKVVSENRTAGNFKDISTSAVYNLVVQQGSTNSIRVEAEENLQQYIETVVKGNGLEIRTKRGYNLNPTKDVTVYVTTKEVGNLSASGACNITGQGQLKGDNMSLDLSGATRADLHITAKKLDVGMSGASKVNLKGVIGEVKYEASGSSQIYADELQSQQVVVEMSGAGDARVFAEKKLDVQVSGVAKVKYKGEPSITKSVSGMGRISKL